MSDQAEFKPTEFVIVGRTLSKTEGKRGTQVGVVLRRILPDGQLGSREIYTSKPLRHRTVGGVYRMNASATSIYSSSAEYLRRWEDEGTVVEWQLEAAAFELSLTAAKRERDDSKPLVLEVLAPIARAYSKTNWQGRLALEVLILNYLRTAGAKYSDDEE